MRFGERKQLAKHDDTSEREHERSRHLERESQR
jgi:hypothetical protein